MFTNHADFLSYLFFRWSLIDFRSGSVRSLSISTASFHCARDSIYLLSARVFKFIRFNLIYFRCKLKGTVICFYSFFSFLKFKFQLIRFQLEFSVCSKKKRKKEENSENLSCRQLIEEKTKHFEKKDFSSIQSKQWPFYTRIVQIIINIQELQKCCKKCEKCYVFARIIFYFSNISLQIILQCG